MKTEKKMIVVGMMKSCKNGFHTGDEVYDPQGGGYAGQYWHQTTSTQFAS